MRKFIIAITAVMLLLCACSVPAGSKEADYGGFEGYYSSLAYEVKGDSGAVAERLYVLSTDEEHENVVGAKDVFFDEDGDMIKYTVTIGVTEIEQIVEYNEGENSTYYTEMYFEGGSLTRTVWDNSYLGESGARMQSKGSEEYRTDGKVKTFREELYRNGELETTTLREYAEDGTLTSETIQ